MTSSDLNCKACKCQCKRIVANVPTFVKSLKVRTWSWNVALREEIVLHAGDQLQICGSCTFERMCYHNIVINNSDHKTFRSDDITMILNKCGIPLPEHFLK